MVNGQKSLATPGAKVGDEAQLVKRSFQNWRFQNQWMLQHEIEKVSPEEMQKRWDAMCGECSGSEPT